MKPEVVHDLGLSGQFIVTGPECNDLLMDFILAQPDPIKSALHLWDKYVLTCDTIAPHRMNNRAEFRDLIVSEAKSNRRFFLADVFASMGTEPFMEPVLEPQSC